MPKRAHTGESKGARTATTEKEHTPTPSSTDNVTSAQAPLSSLHDGNDTSTRTSAPSYETPTGPVHRHRRREGPRRAPGRGGRAHDERGAPPRAVRAPQRTRLPGGEVCGPQSPPRAGGWVRPDGKLIR